VCVCVLCFPVFLVLLKGCVWLVKFCFLLLVLLGVWCWPAGCALLVSCTFWRCYGFRVASATFLEASAGMCAVFYIFCCFLTLFVVSDVAPSDRGPVRITCHAVPSFSPGPFGANLLVDPPFPWLCLFFCCDWLPAGIRQGLHLLGLPVCAEFGASSSESK